jgi:uncharacterized protein YndB with AHSA1/START domain
MAEQTLVYATYINATPEKVWEALTTPAFNERYWSGRSFRTDWTVGSPIEIVTDEGAVESKGEVLTFDPPTTLSYATEPSKWAGPTRVTFQIEQPVGDVVRLTVIHEGIDTESPAYKMTAEGWTAIMSSLKSLVETGEPLPFPKWRG